MMMGEEGGGGLRWPSVIAKGLQMQGLEFDAQ